VLTLGIGSSLKEVVMFQRTLHRSPAVLPGWHGPPWRLLIESPDETVAISNFDAFRDAGFEVTTCSGPSVRADECPLVRGEACPLVAEADVVLFDLTSDRRDRPAVLAAMKAGRPELPVLVRSSAPAAAVPGGCSTLRTTTSVHGQVLALQRAVT
jgi:hypothetical protein